MPVDEELIDRFIDRDVSDDEAADLVQWLKVPANLERFARRAELHSDLRNSLRRRRIQSNALGQCSDTDSASTLSRQPNRSRWRLSRPKVGFGVIALSTAVCLLVAFVMSSGERRPALPQQKLAIIVRKIDALLTSGESTWGETGLAAGTYHLQRGLLHLRFDGGVMVYVEAPARFEAVSGKRILLHNGRLSASVPPQAVGFAVDTPQAEVVDFGTEFSIDVESGASEVHVFDGLVRIQPRTKRGGDVAETVDLRTSQAVKIQSATRKYVNIELAKDRFIRNFDEPKRKYARSVKQFSPVAYYRMPIRDKGLVSEPSQYSGEVLTGKPMTGGQNRPPHASGVFAGGSLRVGADSTGRGGRIDTPPPLTTGHFTLAVFVYLEASQSNRMVATNMHGDEGSFALSLDERGLPTIAVRKSNGERCSVSGNTTLPLTTWRQLVVTADGDQLRLYEEGVPVASTQCESIATSLEDTLWFGTKEDGTGLWAGRIDELALFDRALSDEEIAELYQAAVAEMARSE